MKGQILVIDDNLMDVKIAAHAIESTGFACFGFTEYQKGLDWAAENVPRMVLLDLVMPSITGFDLIPRIREIENAAKAPIVIMSGKNHVEDVQRAITLGATDYIVKPLDPLVLQEKVQRLESLNAEEYLSIEFNREERPVAHFGKPFSMLSASEFGLTVRSLVPLPPGEMIEIIGLTRDFFGIDRLWVRSLSCAPTPDKKEYIIQLTFVALQEPQRQVIRRACRQLWVRAKKEVM